MRGSGSTQHPGPGPHAATMTRASPLLPIIFLQFISMKLLSKEILLLNNRVWKAFQDTMSPLVFGLDGSVALIQKMLKSSPHSFFFFLNIVCVCVFF